MHSVNPQSPIPDPQSRFPLPPSPFLPRPSPLFLDLEAELSRAMGDASMDELLGGGGKSEEETFEPDSRPERPRGGRAARRRVRRVRRPRSRALSRCGSSTCRRGPAPWFKWSCSG